jgi:proteic killer suppression protein
MILNFKHKGLKLFFEKGSTAKVNPNHADKLHDILQLLDVITRPEQMNMPGWRFHTLIGNMSGFYSITVNKNWRIIFSFDGSNVTAVDYLDYH